MTYPLKSVAKRRYMATLAPEQRYAITSNASRARWYGNEKTPACPRCGGKHTNRAGRAQGKQRWTCRDCNRWWAIEEQRQDGGMT